MTELKKGINLGNHYETGRFEPEALFQDWYVDVLKSLGFDHIRLPVRWSSYCDDEDMECINADFMAEVKRVVNILLDSGFKVILNVHHFGAAANDPKAAESQLHALWKQISKEFKDCDDNLIFEILNEPLSHVDPAVWNQVQNGVVSEIRKTNPSRTIMIGSVNYNNIFSLKDLVPPENDNNIIASFHYYLPMEFTHQGAPWDKNYVDFVDVTWDATEEDLSFINNALNVAVAWSEKYGLPVNCGEFGAYKKGDMESRARWTETIRKNLEKNNISWTYWEFNHGFGICEREEPKLKPQLVDALLK